MKEVMATGSSDDLPWVIKIEQKLVAMCIKCQRSVDVAFVEAHTCKPKNEQESSGA